MSDLREIFYSLDRLCDKWDPYFDVYETWFSRFVNKSPRILEIGIYKGGSAELWLKYFGPGAHVVGVDINPGCKQFEGPGFDVVIGDTGNPVFWHAHGAAKTGPFAEQFDIIIDDGGHHMVQQITALENGYWSMLKNGGIYLCEDTHTSYWDHWSNSGYKKDTNFIEYSKNIIDGLHADHTTKGPDGETFLGPQIVRPIGNDVLGIHYYDSMVVIEKGIPKPFKRVFSTNKVEELSNDVSSDMILNINTRK